MTSTPFPASSIFDLSGAVALVSGGGTGIGLTAALSLASNGAKVYITGRRAEKLQEAVDHYQPSVQLSGGSLHPIQCDVSSKDDLRRAASVVQESDGLLHILVNNAGVEGPVTKLGEDKEKLTAEEISAIHLEKERMEDWDHLFRINNHAIFFATMAFLPLLSKGNASPPKKFVKPSIWSASVINVTSISGLVKTSQSHYAYNSSKAAANHLTQMLAYELSFSSKLNIRVNAIAPGLFATEMTAGKKSVAGKSNPEDLVGFTNPAGRVGEETEMASIVLLLASNNFVTGQVVAVDGGFVTAVPANH
ncbi:NAD(P)-binding protein [Violaceomyces palustris]|uniref:NAD(P)-binding protein n=1 Tax=Violaceomyces palustris TaxID=1673888 RepID=A0ACD0NXQ4_9BASI|nr:NAD(P)-binding protein [Violaceomyces palustris]